MSFLKQEPPKPTLAFKNLLPILLSILTALATSLMSASEGAVTSRTVEFAASAGEPEKDNNDL